MKLTSTQVHDVLNQCEAQVIPGDHPTMPQLESIFGSHTFFLGAEGLHVVERADVEGNGRSSAYLVKVASWTDDQRTSLRPQEAELAAPVAIDPVDDPAA